MTSSIWDRSRKFPLGCWYDDVFVCIYNALFFCITVLGASQSIVALCLCCRYEFRRSKLEFESLFFILQNDKSLKTLQGIPPKIGECFFQVVQFSPGNEEKNSTASGLKSGPRICRSTCPGIFQPKGFSSGSIAIPWDDAQPTTVRLEPVKSF